jgi:hypothetical protein
MFAIPKIAIPPKVITLAALVSIAILPVLNIAHVGAVDKTAATQVAQRFPLSSEMLTPVPVAAFAGHNEPQATALSGKDDRLPKAESCAWQNWPYLSQQCLVAADGVPLRSVSRVITIERRVDDNTSELIRMPVADLAQR